MELVAWPSYIISYSSMWRTLALPRFMHCLNLEVPRVYHISVKATRNHERPGQPSFGQWDFQNKNKWLFFMARNNKHPDNFKVMFAGCCLQKVFVPYLFDLASNCTLRAGVRKVIVLYRSCPCHCWPKIGKSQYAHSKSSSNPSCLDWHPTPPTIGQLQGAPSQPLCIEAFLL